MTFDLSPEQARTIEHMAWFIRHPEVWEGGRPTATADIPVISWPEGVEPHPVEHNDHHSACRRTAPRAGTEPTGREPRPSPATPTSPTPPRRHG